MTKTFLFQLFQQCLIKVLNVDLWKCYLNYVRDTKNILPSFRFDFFFLLDFVERLWDEKKSDDEFLSLLYFVLLSSSKPIDLFVHFHSRWNSIFRLSGILTISSNGSTKETFESIRSAEFVNFLFVRLRCFFVTFSFSRFWFRFDEFSLGKKWPRPMTSPWKRSEWMFMRFQFGTITLLFSNRCSLNFDVVFFFFFFDVLVFFSSS